MEDIHRTTRHWTFVSVTGITAPGFAEHFEFENASMQIRGRGQSSWRMGAGIPNGLAPYGGKRPFRIRFANNHDTTRPQNDFIRPILDSGFAAREWTFIANQSDKTLMRNYSAYYLGRLLAGEGSMPFGTNAQLVHVYMAADRRTAHLGEDVTLINNQPFDGQWVYQGIYQMSDQLNQPQAGRVDIITDNNPAISEFLFEMCRHELFRYRNPDHYTANPNWPYLSDTPWPRPHVIIDEGGPRERPFMIEAGGRDEEHAQFHQTVAYVENFLQNVDAALASGSRNLIEQWIDIPSFIDFYLVQELYKNIDINTSSVRFTIRGQEADRRLYAGPLWDFDIAAGNAAHQANYQPSGGYSPQGEWVTFRCAWFRDLLSVPAIRAAARARWAEIKDAEVLQLLGHIDTVADTYADCFARNFDRWQIMDMHVWPNPPSVAAIDTHRGQVDYLIDWLEQRSAWMTWWL